MHRPSVVAAFAAAVSLAALALPGAAPGATRDYAGTALNVIPSGQYGSVPPPANADDQLKLYDGLTPLTDKVTKSDLTRFFKPERFGTKGQGPLKTEKVPRKGVTIVRDRFNVPHITGKTRNDVIWAAGWVLAEDRGLLIEAARGPARVAALDVPGLDAFGLLTSLRGFKPSAQAEKILSGQTKVLLAAGKAGRQILKDIDVYSQGINAFRKANKLAITPWGRNDTYAINALAGFIFGRGGGDEVRRSMLLDALNHKLGAGGATVWNDLRQVQDPETPVTVPGSFPYPGSSSSRAGNVIIDNGSLDTAAATAIRAVQPRPHASNFLIVGAKRSKTGHPLFVAGPQIGYFYPGLTLEMDLHGGGIDARGATTAGFPGTILIGRGADFAWSLTSAGSDVIDQYAETLCGGDDFHYLYKGTCRAMGAVDAGEVPASGSEAAREVTYRTTVHGPVIGYATSGGTRVALSKKRSSFGKDVLWQLPFYDLTNGKVTSPKTFMAAFARSPFTFNAGYADDRHIAMFSAGFLPKRPSNVDPGLPTKGTGAFEWKGLLSAKAHPQAVDPPSGLLVNWNNKPARWFGAADDEWAYGPIYRVKMLNDGLAKRAKHDLASVVSAMNGAATRDLRAVTILNDFEAVLKGGPAPSALGAKMLQLLDAWRDRGAQRLDANGDGNEDDPAAAIMSVLFREHAADAIMRPVLGDLVDQLNVMINRDPGTAGDFAGGWYSYIDKDLRSVRGAKVKGPYKTRFCGLGDLTACRAALLTALEDTGAQLTAAQGPDPTTWRQPATRIDFKPGVLGKTIRYTNRPSGIQQVISFTGHRAVR